LTKKVLVKDLTIQVLIIKVEELAERLEKSEKENELLRHENTVLKAENAMMKTQVAELRAHLDSNSRNSSKPPSSDGYKKKSIKPAFPKGKGSSHGGQKGHKGHTLQQVKAPDQIVACIPDICTCGHEFEKGELMLAEKRQVFDLPQPKLEVTEYQIFKASCPTCGKEQKGIAPEGVNAPVRYGNKVKAFVVLLNVHYKLPFKCKR